MCMMGRHHGPISMAADAAAELGCMHIHVRSSFSGDSQQQRPSPDWTARVQANSAPLLPPIRLRPKPQPSSHCPPSSLAPRTCPYPPLLLPIPRTPYRRLLIFPRGQENNGHYVSVYLDTPEAEDTPPQVWNGVGEM